MSLQCGLNSVLVSHCSRWFSVPLFSWNDDSAKDHDSDSKCFCIHSIDIAVVISWNVITKAWDCCHSSNFIAFTSSSTWARITQDINLRPSDYLIEPFITKRRKLSQKLRSLAPNGHNIMMEDTLVVDNYNRAGIFIILTMFASVIRPKRGNKILQLSNIIWFFWAYSIDSSYVAIGKTFKHEKPLMMLLIHYLQH